MPEEVVDQVMEEGSKSRFNAIIAILVSITATFLALCHVKSENIVQRMHEIDSELVDQWNYYQAKSMKQKLEEMAVEQTQIALENLTATPNFSNGAAMTIRGYVSGHKDAVEKYVKEKKETQGIIDGLKVDKQKLQVFDDQFDICEAVLSISLSLFAMSILTRKQWLLGVAIGFLSIGLVIGGAGLFNHPIPLARVAHLFAAPGE